MTHFFNVQVKGWGKLLGAFATTSKLESELINKIQVYCYEDAKLMKLFAEVRFQVSLFE